MTITYEEAAEGLGGWNVEDDGDGAFTVELRDGTRCVYDGRGHASVDLDIGGAQVGGDTSAAKAKAEALRARWLEEFGHDRAIKSALEGAFVSEQEAYMGPERKPVVRVVLSLTVDTSSVAGMESDLNIIEAMIGDLNGE
jgi:hypothetical protein